jgi:hypothetical protein
MKCAHCNGTGKCENGEEGNACHTCARKARFFFFRCYAGKVKGAICSRCSGDGDIETYTDSLNERIRPALAMTLLPVLILVPVAMHESEQFSALLAFCSSLAGAIVTHFYANKKNNKKLGGSKGG